MKTLENIKDLKKLLLNPYTIMTMLMDLLMTLPTTSRYNRN